MRISVFGLGYVGAVSAACFAESGHEVIGCDVNELKVQIINEGRSPVVEPGVDVADARRPEVPEDLQDFRLPSGRRGKVIDHRHGAST